MSMLKEIEVNEKYESTLKLYRKAHFEKDKTAILVYQGELLAYGAVLEKPIVKMTNDIAGV